LQDEIALTPSFPICAWLRLVQEPITMACQATQSYFAHAMRLLLLQKAAAIVIRKVFRHRISRHASGGFSQPSNFLRGGGQVYGIVPVYRAANWLATRNGQLCARIKW
jgi:hypothetical protein